LDFRFLIAGMLEKIFLKENKLGKAIALIESLFSSLV